MSAPASVTRLDLDAAGLGDAARRAGDVAAACRMLAVAFVLDEASRADAARTGGMNRQTLLGWVHRCNAEGLAGLSDRHADGTPPPLSCEQQAEVAERVCRGPDLTEHGVTRWRRANLARTIAERSGVALAERSINLNRSRSNAAMTTCTSARSKSHPCPESPA